LQDALSPSKDALGLFQRFLLALADPDAGASLYALHAVTAVLRANGGLRAAAEIDAQQFADTHQQIVSADRESLPEFVAATLLNAVPDPGAAPAVCWFECVEAREQRRLIIALGVQPSDAGLRVGWCTLAARVEPWSFQDGLLKSLADYAWMRKSEPARPRVLLDASYFRRHRPAPGQLTTLPDARFSCQMSTVCCRNDFEITLAGEAQLVIDAIRWGAAPPPAGGTKLPVRPDGRLQLKSASAPCRFLGDAGQCRVHQAVGRQPFETCAIYPYTFARTPEGIAVAMSPVCPSARQGIGAPLLEHEEDLRDRLAQAEPRATDVYRLAPDREVAWADFRLIEQALLSCLASEELPMRRRLYVGSRILGAVLRHEPLDSTAWIAEPLPPITAELRAAICGMLEKVLRWDRTVLQAAQLSLPQDLAALELRDSAVVARILRNTLFSKSYSYEFDLTTAFNFGIVLYLLTLVMQASSPGPLPERYWREIGSLGTHGLLKNLLHEGVPEGFRSVFATSEFGQWMLVA
jgi:hypothetical protein